MAQGAVHAINMHVSEDPGKEKWWSMNGGGGAGSEGGYRQCSRDRMFDSYPHSGPWAGNQPLQISGDSSVK